MMKGRAYEATRRYTRRQRVTWARLACSVCPSSLASRRNGRRSIARSARQEEEGLAKRFAKLQDRFENHYAEELRFAFGPDAKISHTATSQELQDKFLRCMHRHRTDEVRIGYHGTQRRNFDPICRSGLRIPGNGGVRVRNGSAHGVGIYTARIGGAVLSLSFTQGCRSMLVCGVLDDADEVSMRRHDAPAVAKAARLRCGRPAKRPDMAVTRPAYVAPGQGRLGRLAVHKRTQDVLHVGEAQVIFNECRVVPLLRVDNLPRMLYRQEWQAAAGPECVPEPEALAAWRGGNPNRCAEPTPAELHGERLESQELLLRRDLARRRRQRQRLAERRAKAYACN